MKYNFDTLSDRRNTDCMKFDDLQEMFGRTDLTPLWVADMDFDVCPAITEAIKRRLEHRVYGYTSPRDSYWQSIIDFARDEHRYEFSREEINFVPGVIKGIIMALLYFTERGDKVVIQPPVYHMFKFTVAGAQRVIVENPLKEGEDGYYKMDFDGLEQIFQQDHPKAMILCNPHNPEGVCWDRETLGRVARLAKEYGVMVLSDEIHSDLALFGYEYIPFLESCEEAKEVGIAYSAPSKTFNIPGIVSAWCVVKNPALRTGFFKWLNETELSENNIISLIATETAYRQGREWLYELRQYIEGNIVALEEFFRDNIPNIKPIRPQASFLVWLDCRALGLTRKQLDDLFEDKAHLALNRGYIFGSEGIGFMRINVATSREYLLTALGQLSQAIKELNK